MAMLRNSENHPVEKSWLDRALSVFADVKAGEGATAALMLVNIFLLLVCYSVIKTVREPLILLGGGAEVRSYAAAGQALLLIGFVPLYSWFTTRVGRARLLVGVTVFFLAGIELFAALVAAGTPYVGVAFFIWVGIFNMSLVAQFWSFANDIYSKDAGARLFPIIMIGMTAGAPLGSLVAGRLFQSGMTPAAILHVAAVLLMASLLLYLAINARVTRHGAAEPLLDNGGGFQLVLGNPYLRLIAALVVLLNVVNTTGEYLMARLLTAHVDALAAITVGFNKEAYIGAFSGEYQFWVNVTALFLQAFVASRVVKHRGLQGALLALPLIALGGYAVIAAGATFSVVRWIKTAENATDYSLMNTARQLLWLPTSREDKYKAKQAIDTFFVRGGDVVSALFVFAGVKVMNLSVEQFAGVNVALTLVWLGLAFRILGFQTRKPRLSPPVLVRVAAFAKAGRFATRVAALASRSALADRRAPRAAVVVALLIAVPAFAQDTRQDQVAAEQADKATRLHAYTPDALERRLHQVEKALSGDRPLYAYIGRVFEGGGLAAGPGYRARLGDTGTFDAHAAWSVKNYRGAQATVKSPSFAGGRVTVGAQAQMIEAPEVAFYGVGNDTLAADRGGYAYSTSSVGLFTRVQASRALAFGGGVDSMWHDAGAPVHLTSNAALHAPVAPAYARSHLFAEVDTRTSPAYTRRGGLYRVDWSNYRQTNSGAYSFDRLDAEAQQFIPLMRENWVIALRALASTTSTAAGHEVPHFLMPSLGGSRTLRGYSAWRFRDRNRVLLTGEYRWTAGPFVDMALFLDAGKVSARADDLASRGFTRTYGVGVTLHTLTSTLTRIEVARTPDGTSLVLSFGPSF